MSAISFHPFTSWKRGGVVLSLTLLIPLALPAATNVASASTSSASALMTLALTNAVKAGWVHEVEHASAPGHFFSMDNDIGTAEGRQIIDTNGAHAEVIVFKTEAYIYGDKKAIADYFQLSTTDPGTYANKWLSISATSSGYNTVSNAVTLKSDFADVTIPGVVTEGSPVVLHGQKVIPIHGAAAKTSTTPALKAVLYVTTSKPVRPVELHLKSTSETVTATWSKWGHAVTLTAPAKSSPITP